MSKELPPITLLRISREASSVFRSIYRVRVPLPVKGGDASDKTLYISPENDTIWAVCDQLSGDTVALVAFLHDLVAYDPKGIGAVHLAIGGANLNDSNRLAELNPSDLCHPARKSITRLLSSSLQTFYAVISPSLEGRCMLPIMSRPHGQFHHNRSVPIFPRTQTYTFLERDPRSVDADLAHVAVNTDPRRTVWLWERFKANFGITRHLQGRYILGIRPYQDPGIDGRAGLVRFLQKADEGWEKYTDMVGQPVWGERMSREEYEAQRTSLSQAAGFWVFPQEALGDIPSVNEMKYMDTGEWEPEMVKDLSKFRPGICVFNLP
ncbi:uncharacterized protein DNG_04383 [Cephalotrichum gorgonifer]|uniref:Uncharacterized protein n=1 Tax=Cephalotrichum gorgonifer TaxID=2041049 RepID=A0AAE8SUH6_9PEZI|nr:uncharacterized protein DNG_04383 [Cephalotrichum gorgonifer]